MEKLAYIRKQVNGKYKIFSEEGKSLGEYDFFSEAKERLKQIEYFKHKKSKILRRKLLKVLAYEEPSYSAIMRELCKKDKAILVIFMSAFKRAFDDSVIEELENPDKIALLAAMKSINYEAE